MKMHTFFLSGKAIAIVSGALGAGGVLLFVSGVLVGVRVRVDGGAAPRRVAAAPAPALPAGGSQASGADQDAGTAAAAAPPAAATTASTAGPADAAWPFTASSYAPSADPLPASPAAEDAPIQAPAPTPAPAPRDTVRRRQSARISAVAYHPDDDGADAAADAATPPSTADVRDRDAGRYLVQVGTFRVESHARELATRLEAAGYHASVSVRQEGERAMHVVRVSGFVGVDAAERAAAKIGGAEQLVAYVVPITR